MSQFDEDVRSLVQVKVVHGSWERESANRIRVDVRVTIDSLFYPELLGRSIKCPDFSLT